MGTGTTIAGTGQGLRPHRVAFSAAIFAGLLTIYALSPIRTPYDSRWSIHTAASLLAGNWGELRIGRDFVPQFWNLTVFDPFGTKGAGANQMLASIITGPTAVRASNRKCIRYRCFHTIAASSIAPAA